MNNAINGIDISTINELKEILEGDISSIFDEFKHNTIEMLDKLKSAIKDDDTDSAIHLIHTIKGSSGNLGLTAILTIAQEIEKGIRLQNNIDLQAMVDNLESAVHQTLSDLVKMELLTE